MGLMFGKDALDIMKTATMNTKAPDNPTRVNSMDSQQAQKLN